MENFKNTWDNLAASYRVINKNSKTQVKMSASLVLANASVATFDFIELAKALRDHSPLWEVELALGVATTVLGVVGFRNMRHSKKLQDYSQEKIVLFEKMARVEEDKTE